MYKVNVTIGDIAKPGEYAERGFFKDQERLFNTGAITALEKGEKVPESAVVLKAADATKEPAKEVKKA